MVIQCSSCDTRFKLADDKLKPGGVKVRCSKCKEVFTVMPPEEEAPAPEKTEEASSDATANDWSDIGGDTDSSESEESGGIDWSDIVGGDDSDSAEESTPGLSDDSDESTSDDFSFGGDDESSDSASLSFDDDSNSDSDSISFDDDDTGDVSEDDFGFDEPVGEGAQDEFSFDEDSSSSLDVSEDEPDFDWDGSSDDSSEPDDFDFGDAEGDENEGDLDFSSVALEEKNEPEPAPTPAMEQPSAAMAEDVEKPLSAKGPQTSTGKKRGRKQKKAKKKGFLRGLFMLVFFILLLAGGHAGILFWKGYWKGDPAELANLDHQTVHIQVYQELYAELTGGKVVKEPEGEVTVVNMNGYFIENSAAGTLFVIEGNIKNEFQEPRSAIAVRGILFDQAGKPVMRKKAYCGNKLNDEDLRSLSLDKINERLGNQFGDSLSNLDVSPSAVLPYTIVFGKLPENLSEFNVEVAESAPGSK